MDKEKKTHLDVNLDFLEDKKSIITTKGDDNNKPTYHVSQADFPNVRPWVRFVARNIDNYIFAFILGLFWAMISTSSLPKSDIGFGLIALFLWIFVEAVFLSSWGTTFGKWLLKVKLRDNEDKKLTFPVALQRSFLVWLKGLGIGFPIVSLFTLISAYSELTKKGITTWDRDCHLIVSHQTIGIIRTAVAIILIGIFLMIIIGLKG
jgi:membrane protease YdiL (CAAX protease family)